DGAGPHTRTPGFILDQESVVIVADHDRRREARPRAQPLEGGGEKRLLLVVGEADELLGIHGARQRPQARAGTAGQYDGMDCSHKALVSGEASALAAPFPSGIPRGCTW